MTRNLSVARDLRSHRIYREEFWKVAEQLGYSEEFPPTGFESIEMSHVSFVEKRLRRVVAITDTSHGGGRATGDSMQTARTTRSITARGRVSGSWATWTLATLGVISPRLTKIDEFSRPTLEEGEEVSELFLKRPEPAPEKASESSPEAAGSESEQTAEAEAPAAQESPQPPPAPEADTTAAGAEAAPAPGEELSASESGQADAPAAEPRFGWDAICRIRRRSRRLGTREDRSHDGPRFPRKMER